MKIAIHKSSWGFSRDWIAYCEKQNIDFKVVDCYASDIVQQIADCDALMWHHNHSSARDVLFSKQLLFSIQQMGKKTFPDFNTGWHFDDKVGQKYLLEAMGAPIPPTWIFYDKKSALNWATVANFPKVFKLRNGAGSANVRLVENKRAAKKLINQAFRRGISTYDRFGDLREQFRKFRWSNRSLFVLMKSIRRLFVSTQHANVMGRQKGYVLFQEFIKDNSFDIRVVVIGGRAFAIKRYTRANDFRASGSGFIVYNKHEIDDRCVNIAFAVTSKIKAQCVAYDFVFDHNNQPLIVEISYGFEHKAYFACPGYWDSKMEWHETHFNPAEWIVEDLIKTLK